MTWNEIVSAVCIYLSAVILSISLQEQKKLTILFIQIFASLFYLANYLFVLQITPTTTIGAITAGCEILRLLVFFFIERSKKFNTTRCNLVAGIAFCVIFAVCAAFAWSGWLSIFPLIGAILVSLALGSKNLILIKIAFIMQAACIAIYLCLIGLWVNVAAEVFVFVLGIIGLITLLGAMKRKEEVQ